MQTLRHPLLIVIFGCLSVLLQGGCATLPPVLPGTPVPAETGRALVAEWRQRSAAVDALQGVARVRVQTAERTVSGSQVLLVERPDRLRAETLSPFGTPLLLLAADGPRLAVLLPADNLYYSGRATPENLGRFARLPLRLSDLVGILLGRPPLLDERGMSAYRLPDGGWRVELDAAPRRQELLFDGSRRLTQVSYHYRDELQLRIAYDGFAADPPEFPRRIELTLPQQRIQASLAFSELAINRESRPETFTLRPPAGVVQVPLDADGSGDGEVEPESGVSAEGSK